MVSEVSDISIRASHVSVSNPPDSFLCPVTRLLMEHPVTTANGNMFEYAAIARWLSSHDTDPATNEVLKSKTLIYALSARSLIRDWVASNPHVAPKFRNENAVEPPGDMSGSGDQQASQGSSSMQYSDAWFYLDQQENMQGPFKTADMRRMWCNQGHSQADLKIRNGNAGIFRPLVQVFPNLPQAFLAGPLSPSAKPTKVQLRAACGALKSTSAPVPTGVTKNVESRGTAQQGVPVQVDASVESSIVTAVTKDLSTLDISPTIELGNQQAPQESSSTPVTENQVIVVGPDTNDGNDNNVAVPNAGNEFTDIFPNHRAVFGCTHLFNQIVEYIGLCDIIYLAEYDDEFWDSCLRRNLKLINNMVQACGQWEIVDRLWHACLNNHLFAVQILMPHVEDVDDWKTPQNEHGCGGGETLLHLVAQDGLANIARELIKGGANIEAKANYGQETPLFFAAESGVVGVVDVLLEAGAKKVVYADGPNIEGMTPLHYAARSGVEGAADIVRALLRDNLVVDKFWWGNRRYADESDRCGDTALHEATSQEVYQALLDCGARKGIKNRKGHRA